MLWGMLWGVKIKYLFTHLPGQVPGAVFIQIDSFLLCLCSDEVKVISLSARSVPLHRAIKTLDCCHFKLFLRVLIAHSHLLTTINLEKGQLHKMEPRQERAKKVSIPVTRAFSMEIKFTRTPSNEKKGEFKCTFCTLCCPSFRKQCNAWDIKKIKYLT